MVSIGITTSIIAIGCSNRALVAKAFQSSESLNAFDMSLKMTGSAGENQFEQNADFSLNRKLRTGKITSGNNAAFIYDDYIYDSYDKAFRNLIGKNLITRHKLLM